MKTIINSHPRVTGRKEFDRLAGEIGSIAAPFPPVKRLVGVNLVGERRMASLNRKYRGRRGAAQILTFDYSGPDGGDLSGEEVTAEIFLCWNPILSVSSYRRVSPEAYLLRLVVHGLCHLEGFRHGNEDEEREMEREEMKHLGKVLPRKTVERLFD